MKLPFMAKKRAATGSDVELGRDKHNNDHLGKPATAKGRTLLLLAQLLAALSIACLTVGTAIIQHRVNGQNQAPGRYNDVLQSAHWTPYPNSHRNQWQMLWWIICGNLFVWLLTLLLVTRAARIVQWNGALCALHAYFLMLCTFAIDSFLWLDRAGTSHGIFGHNQIRTVLAGLFGLAAADGLTILALGMITSTRHIDSRNVGRVDRVVDGPVVHHEPMMQQREVPMPQSTQTTVNPMQTTNFSGDGNAHPVRVHQGPAFPHGTH